jgi:hypothetical protein
MVPPSRFDAEGIESNSSDVANALGTADIIWRLCHYRDQVPYPTKVFLAKWITRPMMSVFAKELWFDNNIIVMIRFEKDNCYIPTKEKKNILIYTGRKVVCTFSGIKLAPWVEQTVTIGPTTKLSSSRKQGHSWWECYEDWYVGT